MTTKPLTAEVEEAVKSNPEALRALMQMKETMDALNLLREAGVAKGATLLKPPHSGRYGELPLPTRQAKASKKMR